MDGRSLLDRDPDRPLLFEAEHTATTFTAVRTRAWEWVEYPNGQRELYDVVRDPYQLTSRHADPRLALGPHPARRPARQAPHVRRPHLPFPVMMRRLGPLAALAILVLVACEPKPGTVSTAPLLSDDDRLTYGAWAADMDLDGDQDLIVNDHGEPEQRAVPQRRQRAPEQAPGRVRALPRRR